MSDKPSAALPNTLIRASAGSGKTFQLTNRYLALAHRGVPFERVVATTFTRKAAGEILARVLTRLADAAEHSSDRKVLASFIADGKLNRGDCLELLTRLAKRLHRLRIGTLDSLFGQMARAFALELDLPPGWTIADETADEELRADAVAELLAAHDTGDVTRMVHLLAKGAHEQSIVHLIHNTVRDLYGLYQETAPDAWRQLQRRSPLDDAALERAVLDLGAVPLDKDKRVQTARDKDLATALAGHWEQFLAKGLAAKVVEGDLTYYRKELPASLVAAYKPLVDHAAAILLNRYVAQNEGTYELLQRFDGHYRRLQQSRRLLRFQDITNRLGAWSTQMSRTAAGRARELALLDFRLDARIDHLLLDEFQDTSLAQWQVLAPIAKQVVSGGESSKRPGDSAASTSFFCVGDPKQAIYGWRGGLAEIFEALDQQFPTLHSEHLDVSRRSSPAVIETVNKVFFEPNRRMELDRGGGALVRWCAAFPRHQTAREGLPGYVTLETAPTPLFPTDDDGPEPPVEHDIPRDDRRPTRSGDEDEEEPLDAESYFARVARRIQELVTEAPGHSVGVLMRSNDGIAQMIHELRRLGVPASEEGGNPPTDSAAVQLVVSALRFADHPSNSIARCHMVHSPLGAELGLSDTFDTTRAGAETGAECSARLRRELAEEGYGAVLERWSRVLLPHVTARDRRRLEQVTELAYRRQTHATLRPSDFVDLLETTRMPDTSSVDVRVTTIHQSKGLEYDIVVLPELKSQLCGQPDQIATGRSELAGPIDVVCRYVPSALQPLLPRRFQQLFQAQEDADVVESMCVLYVALTRAVHALHLIVPDSKPNEKKLPASFAGFLRSALTEGQLLGPGTVAYEHGDRHWARRRNVIPLPAVAQESAAQKDTAQTGAARVAGADETTRRESELRVRLAPHAGPRRRGLDRVAPSGLEGGARRRLAETRDDAPHRGRQRGTLIHAWCERLEWFDAPLPSDEELVRIARETQEIAWSPAELAQVLAEFHRAVESEELRTWLVPSFYDHPRRAGWSAEVEQEIAKLSQRRLEVRREWRFAVRRNDELVTGSIDRLVLIWNREQLIAADILDYKTDTVPSNAPEALAERVEYYQPQIDAYRSAASRALRLPPERIAARLVFLAPRRVVTLTTDAPRNSSRHRPSS